MKNNKNLRVIAILIVAILLLCSIPGVGAEKNKTSNEEVLVEQLVLAQEKAVAANEALMQYFYDNGYVTTYPDFFGGCYISENVLHIRLTSSTEETMAVLHDVLAGYEDAVVYEDCSCSQAELQKYADGSAKEIQKQGYDVTYWYVDSINNKIVIGVLAEDAKGASDFAENKQMVGKSKGMPNIVIVEESAYPVADSETVGPGTMLGKCM